MTNLGELSKWEGVVTDSVEKVESTSRDLLDKSMGNEQFNTINAMAESNANDTEEVTVQAGVISEMVDEMSRILKQED